jgi:murein DD-endopeptidase MepM/ murein hydrolase activator NlpD
LNGQVGNRIVAALSGRVPVATYGWEEMGRTVIIDNGAGAYTIYGHLDSISVRQDQSVETGTSIGTMGYSVNAAAPKAKGLPPHLHFALIQAGQTGLADESGPLREMRKWGDYWQGLEIQLTGPVNPNLFGMSDCWLGSTTVGAPDEK